MTDHWTRNRKKWIAHVSPFHLHERRTFYQICWLFSLLMGTKMPHEYSR